MDDPYERFFVRQPPNPQGIRAAVTKDRDRIIHSSAFRRLQGKGQIFGAQKTAFFRNRLTHSLECAQIGRAIARRVQGAHWEGHVEDELDFPDLVEAACLAHDLGHPPFGHNGEEALTDRMAARNGTAFEGNAQSFRVVTFVEPKEFGLTKAGVDRWVWGSDPPRPTIATQIMDAADDIAYATHDFEDGVWADMIPLHLLIRHDPRAVADLEAKVLEGDRRRRGAHVFPDESIEAALRDLLRPIQDAEWAQRPFDRTRFSKSYLKRFVTDLIHYFIHAVSAEGRFEAPTGEIRQRLDLLTGMAQVWMIGRSDLETQQFGQRRLVRDLFDGYWSNPRMLPHLDEWQEVERTTSPRRVGLTRTRRWPEKARLICDHIAGMTDAYAVRAHAAMHQGQEEVELRWAY